MSILRFVARKRLFILAHIAFLMMGAFVFSPPPSAEAAETVIIVSQTVYCDRIDVTYQVISAFPTDYAIITSHVGNTQVGSVNGTGTPSGTYSATVPVSPAQPSGTMVRVEIEINDGNGYFVNRVGTAEACYVEGSGGGGSGEPPNTGGESPPSTWDGYTDGRLNPDMAEYYTVYCANDKVRVVRANPPPSETLTEILIRNLIHLNPLFGKINQDGITITRFNDQITLAGSNGNLAPASGIKYFSLSECLDHNGGEPEAVNHPPTITAESSALYISVESTGSINFRVNDLDHDDLTLSVRVIDPSAVGVIYYPVTVDWDDGTQSYGPTYVSLSNLTRGDQTAVIVTVTDSLGASTSMTFNVIAPGRPDSFGPFSHLADRFFDFLTNLFNSGLCGVPAATGIVIPMASIAYSKRRKNRQP